MSTKDDFYKRVISYHGCNNEYQKQIQISNELNDCFRDIKLILKNGNYDLLKNDYDEDKTKEKIKNASKYLSKNFELSNILTLNPEDEKNLYQRANNFKHTIFGNARRILAYYNTVTPISPYDLPIYLSKNNNCSGSTRISYPYNIESLDPYLEPYFNFINISSINSNYAGPTYIHELTHTQTEKTQTAYKNILNRETLSTFMELMYSYYSNDEMLLQNNIFLDFSNLLLFQIKAKDNSTYNKIYFYSTLMAIELFLIYLDSNEQVKLEIQNDIQKIFNGNMSIEDLLETYNININNIDCERMIRTLSK